MSEMQELARRIRKVNAANGWDTPADFTDPNTIPAKLALVHSEVSEALEAFRKQDRTNFAEELADTVIRLLDLAYGLGIDLDAEIDAKVAKNAARGWRHGGKVI